MTPVTLMTWEEAYCSWGDEREAAGILSAAGEPVSFLGGYQSARERAAKLVEATGCNCDGRQFARPPEMGKRHWPDCPVSLAAEILEEV